MAIVTRSRRGGIAVLPNRAGRAGTLPAPGGFWGDLVGGITRFFGPGGGQLPPSFPCLPGFRRDAQGMCVPTGGGPFGPGPTLPPPGGPPGGGLPPFGPPPGGLPPTFGPQGPPSDPFQLPQEPSGTAVVGAFGIPAMVPDIVGVVEDKRGERHPIRRCIPGLVLGTDNLCYPRSFLGRRNRFRKNKLPVRPPVSAADAKAIRQAERTRHRVADLAKDVGLTVTRGRRRTRK